MNIFYRLFIFIFDYI